MESPPKPCRGRSSNFGPPSLVVSVSGPADATFMIKQLLLPLLCCPPSMPASAMSKPHWPSSFTPPLPLFRHHLRDPARSTLVRKQVRHRRLRPRAPATGLSLAILQLQFPSKTPHHPRLLSPINITSAPTVVCASSKSSAPPVLDGGPHHDSGTLPPGLGTLFERGSPSSPASTLPAVAAAALAAAPADLASRSADEPMAEPTVQPAPTTVPPRPKPTAVRTAVPYNGIFRGDRCWWSAGSHGIADTGRCSSAQLRLDPFPPTH